MLNAMIEKPTRGDWASFAISLVQKYSLDLTLHQIEKMKSSSFKKLVKCKMNELAFWELTQRQKQGEKGRTIMYRSLCMAKYLLPETNLTVSEKTDMFALRSQMNENPCNFGDKINCQMGCSQTQEN